MGNEEDELGGRKYTPRRRLGFLGRTGLSMLVGAVLGVAGCRTYGAVHHYNESLKDGRETDLVTEVMEFKDPWHVCTTAGAIVGGIVLPIAVNIGAGFIWLSERK